MTAYILISDRVLRDLKREIQTAEDKGAETFTLYNKTFLTSYAKYLAEWMEGRLCNVRSN